MFNTSFKNQKGFTLIEIAIVLVIIGLLIGGVLKGQSMIQNAKVKRLVNDIEGLKTAVLTYQDRYNMYPGDESDANAPTSTDTHNGDNDGNFDDTDYWDIEDLRFAGLFSGIGITPPKHSFGGFFRMEYNAAIRNHALVTNIPAEVCQEIDSKYDDGVYTTGDIRGDTAYTAGTTIVNFRWKL